MAAGAAFAGGERPEQGARVDHQDGDGLLPKLGFEEALQRKPVTMRL